MDKEKLKQPERDELGFYPTPDGEFASVTTILGILDKPALVGWSAKMTAEYFRDKVEEIRAGTLGLHAMDLQELVRQAKAHYREKAKEAADIGTEVHELISERFTRILEKKEALFEEGIRDQLSHPWSAFLNWEGMFSPIPKAVEQVVWVTEHKYAGKMDFYGLVRGVNAVVDWKSSNALYPEHVLQLSAYHLAAEIKYDLEIPLAGILRLDKASGFPDWKEFPREALMSARETFLLLCPLYSALKKFEKEVRPKLK